MRNMHDNNCNSRRLSVTTRVVLAFCIIMLSLFFFCKCSDIQSNDHFGITLSNGTDLVLKKNTNNTVSVVNAKLADNGELILPSSINGMDIVDISIMSYDDVGNGLKRIVLPDTLKHISQSFLICDELEEIDIGNSVADINYGIFPYCLNLKSIKVSPNNERYLLENGCLIEKKSNTLVLGISGCTIPYFVEHIGDYAFRSQRIGENVILPTGLKTIGRFAFENCDMSYIDIPDSVCKIDDYAFAATELIEIELPNKLEQISPYLFSDCKKLQKVIIGNNVTDIKADAFTRCPMLETIEVADGNPAFYSDQNCLIEKHTNRLIICSNSGVLSDKIEIIGKGAVCETATIGAVRSIRIPTSCHTIESLSICGYKGILKEVYIPDNVLTIKETAIVLTGNNKDLVVYCDNDCNFNDWHDDWLGNKNNTRIAKAQTE